MKRPVRLSSGEKLVLTANRLLDGRIVWWGTGGSWEPRLAKALLLDPDGAEQVLEEAQKTSQRDGVVGIYEVAVRDTTPAEPVTVREKIRAHGPTVHPQFAVETEQ
ncbi:DUF2849 domain-containing protein [Gluconobacter morbifer]|uniref:DUF2849 domain-containing protein n=1 Tax=Gluconobacter morbifer G707 TaxID=1088869 RepID=G6XM90_9PROT|nr:DUF2849 domain-containing protein [Gluconobacter morbifer]EHH66988.1 hypothetical protein GMO_26080 [Gluconobacter morbifer G707]